MSTIQVPICYMQQRLASAVHFQFICCPRTTTMSTKYVLNDMNYHNSEYNENKIVW